MTEGRKHSGSQNKSEPESRSVRHLCSATTLQPPVKPARPLQRHLRSLSIRASLRTRWRSSMNAAWIDTAAPAARRRGRPSRRCGPTMRRAACPRHPEPLQLIGPPHLFGRNRRTRRYRGDMRDYWFPARQCHRPSSPFVPDLFCIFLPSGEVDPLSNFSQSSSSTNI